MAVILAGVELSGCQTSGVGGNGATVHNRANPWVLQVHRSAASTLVMLGERTSSGAWSSSAVAAASFGGGGERS